MKTCPSCGAQSYRVESQYCQKCGGQLPEHEDVPNINICTNPDCQWHQTQFIYPDDAKFCDVCGSATVFNPNR